MSCTTIAQCVLNTVNMPMIMMQEALNLLKEKPMNISSSWILKKRIFERMLLVDCVSGFLVNLLSRLLFQPVVLGKANCSLSSIHVVPAHDLSVSISVFERIDIDNELDSQSVDLKDVNEGESGAAGSVSNNPVPDASGKVDTESEAKQEEEEIELSMLRFQGTLVVIVEASGDKAGHCGTAEVEKANCDSTDVEDDKTFLVLQAFQVSVVFSFTIIDVVITRSNPHEHVLDLFV